MKLRLFAVAATGTVAADVKASAERGVRLHIRNYAVNTVQEHTVALTLH